MSDDADDVESPDDRRLLSELAAALGLDPVPDRLVEICEGLVAWDDVDHELATLLDEHADEPAGVRGPGAVLADQLSFGVSDGSTVVELRLATGRVTGQVVPAGAVEAVFERLGGALQRTPVDDLGRFVFDDVGSGPARVRLGGPGRWVVTDWFVL
jgi:hypothetical protein